MKFIEKLNKSIHAVHEVMREQAKKIFPLQQLHGKAKPGGRSSCTKPCTFFTLKYKADTNNQTERINWPFNKWSIHKMVILDNCESNWLKVRTKNVLVWECMTQWNGEIADTTFLQLNQPLQSSCVFNHYWVGKWESSPYLTNQKNNLVHYKNPKKKKNSITRFFHLQHSNLAWQQESSILLE